MNAVTAGFEPERARLWAASALAVLLIHLSVAALLFRHIDWKQPILRGTADALDVELAPPSAPPASSATRSTVPQLPQEQQPVQPQPQPNVEAVSPVKPLPQMQPIAQQVAEPQPPTVTPADVAASAAAAAAASVLTAPDLTAFTSSLGQPNAPSSPQEAWMNQVVGQLGRYKSYPRSAVKRRQQDTVTLEISVNRAGQVVYSRIDSRLHYKVLEDEVRKMLRLAAPFPAPPPQLTEQGVVSVPVNFNLVTAKPSPAPASCVKPADPGSAPAGAAATLEQMRAYRGRLNQYLGASGSYLDCLGRGTDATALAARSTAVDQVHALVDRFNAQTRAFETAQAQQVQQAAARLAQAQAAAARAYAACTTPTAPRPAGADLTADTARSYRKQLVGYEAAVRTYLACVNQAQLASATQAGNALTTAQRAELGRTAVQLANAAVLPFDQLVEGFNAQLQHLQASARELAKQAVLARAQAFFPDSAWDTPAPLPSDNCIRIVRSGQIYEAQLCKSNYVKENMGPQGIPVNHALAGIVIVGPQESAESDFAKHEDGARFTRPQATRYTISALQVTGGNHVVLTVDRKSNAAPGAQDDWRAIHFDLALSADGSHLVGQCWTEQKRWDCQLSRHHH